jgi:acyl transferase domain-containing protein
LTVSAHDKPTLLRNAKALGSVASDYYAADLAYTLNLRRSHFSHRAFTILREGHEHEAFEESALYTGVTPKISGGVGFLFTGQGVSYYHPSHILV